MEHKSNTLDESTRAFRSVINHSYHLAPFTVILLLIISLSIIFTSIWLSGLRIAIVVFLVLVPPLIIFTKTDNYAEAIFALVAGLLTALTITWNWTNFVIFFIVWIGFSMLAILIWSLKLAAKDQVIYREAAICIDVSQAEKIEKQLREIARSIPSGTLGPIERANAIRIMAFRKIPLDSMKYMLESVQILTTLSNLDVKSVTLFLIDLSKTLDLKLGLGYIKQIDKILDIYRGMPVSLEEFIKSFINTRRLIISGKMDWDTYLTLFRSGLEKGFLPEEIYEYMQENT